MNVLVFDIETVADIKTGKKLYELQSLNNEDSLSAMQTLRRNKTGGIDFMPHYLQKIVAISVVLKTEEGLKVCSMGNPQDKEKEIISRFMQGMSRYQPQLVSWNGSGFDLPVLHYRMLYHGISAPLYWELGENNSQFRYNNYINRYHYRHLDVMDILANYQSKAYASLDAIATMLGFPGKIGMDGSKVQQAFNNGEIESIRNYCETDVLNTYLVFLKFQLMRGIITEKQYSNSIDEVAQTLEFENKPHFIEFLQNWQEHA